MFDEEDREFILEMREQFIDQLCEGMDEVEGMILSMERREITTPNDDVLRILHTLKGSAGSLEILTLVRYIHEFEQLILAVPVNQTNAPNIYSIIDSMREISNIINLEDVVDIPENDKLQKLLAPYRNVG